MPRTVVATIAVSIETDLSDDETIRIVTDALAYYAEFTGVSFIGTPGEDHISDVRFIHGDGARNFRR